MAVQAACRGGSFAVESVAAFAWTGWQASSGISGNLGLEYARSGWHQGESELFGGSNLRRIASRRSGEYFMKTSVSPHFI